MKKIALLLALALALSCCLLMLASCSEDEGDTSSTAATSSGGTSSAAASSAAASSKAEESSKVEESSEPEEESSEEPGFEKNPDATPNEDGANLALGASYVTSQLYQQGGADVDWGWDENAPIAYPDDDDAELTDGVIGEDDPDLENEYQNPAWVGFHAKAPDYIENGYSYFTVDLGDVYELSKLVVYVGTKALGGGIYVPATVEFLVSEDGENFVSVGTAVPVDDESVPYSETSLECDVTGQYVQVRMTCAGWMFVCEFEAY